MTPWVDLHTIFYSKWSDLYYHHQWRLARTWPLLPLLMTYSNWRTMVGGDLAFGPLIWFNQGSMTLLMNITLEECIFLYFLTHFNVLDLCLWLRGDFVLDFWIVAISCNILQHFARDNFGILQTLKFCLVEASWVFTTCPLKYLDWRSFNSL